MAKKIRNFFLLDIVMLVSSFGALLGWAVWAVSSATSTGMSYDILTAVALLALAGGLLFAYKKGETNIQKMLFGALLAFLVKENAQLFWDSFESGVAAIILTAICAVCAIVIFLSHLLQQSDHAGKSNAPVAGQFCGLLAIVTVVYMLIFGKDLAAYAYLLASTFTYLMVLCMETRIHEYKQIRAKNIAEGTWTEEARKEAKKLFMV